MKGTITPKSIIPDPENPFTRRPSVGTQPPVQPPFWGQKPVRDANILVAFTPRAVPLWLPVTESGAETMLHRHHRTIANLSSNPDLKYLIRDYFDLPRWQSLLPAMLARGLGQADLVLCLLRLRDRHRAARCACELHIAALVGRPIVLG